MEPDSPLAASFSDSELGDMTDGWEIAESSLKRHSHFFLPLPLSTGRSRPRSVPLLGVDDAIVGFAASPMMTVLDDSSSERIDRVSDGADACGDAPELTNGSSDKDGIRYVCVCAVKRASVFWWIFMHSVCACNGRKTEPSFVTRHTPP